MYNQTVTYPDMKRPVRADSERVSETHLVWIAPHQGEPPTVRASITGTRGLDTHLLRANGWLVKLSVAEQTPEELRGAYVAVGFTAFCR